MRHNLPSRKVSGIRLRLPYPFATRLSEPVIPGERLRIESGLAWARLALSTASLVGIYLDPTEPTRYAAFAYTLLILYVAHSVEVLVLLRGRSDVSEFFARVIQGVDVVLPAALTIFTEGPNSPFFVMFFFAIMEAAFRWGFRASFVNSVIALMVQLVEVVLLVWRNPTSLVDAPFELNRMIIRVSYLMITGLVVGYAAEQEKQLRAEDRIIARLAERARSAEGRLNQTVQDVLAEIAGIFRAPEILLTVEELASDRIFAWQIQRRADGTSTVRLHEPGPQERDLYLFPVPCNAWVAQRHAADIASDAWAVCGIDAASRQLPVLPPFDPHPRSPLVNAEASVTGISFELGTTFAGRVLMRDSDLQGGVFTNLRFAQKMLQQVIPGLYNLYLVRRLRSRAGAIERARTARELHDGAIQSLIGAEMQVDVLRRRAASGAGISGVDLLRVQEILRQEVLGLRELMQELRPVDVGPRDLLDFLFSLVDRFRRDTGIAARFVTSLDEVLMSPRLCREIVRITQEALFNVRRHSQAHNVMVRLHSDGSYWNLEIEDDGKGFGFSGCMTSAEMEAAHQGPQVIRERVRHIGGELTIESSPGHGAKLKIALPQPRASAIYA